LSKLKSVHILHTNDIHSHFEQMPMVAAAIRDRITDWGNDCTLIVDIGDHMDRMRIETEGTEGRGNIDIMNATGYEAACLGNNEGLTFAPDTLRNTFKKARFPIIVANMLDATSGELPEWIVPYEIIEKNGVKIGLIGVTINFHEFYRLLGWNVINPFEVLNHWISIVRPIADVIVVLSHLGLSMDEKMAGQIDGIDIILGGHTHHLLEQPLKIRETYIAGAGKFGQYVGHIQIVWDEEARRLVQLNGEVIPVEGFAPAEDIEQIILESRFEGQRNLSKTITRLIEPMDIEWGNESRLGNLLSEGVRQWTGAEIGMVNAGQLLQGLDRGEVNRKRLLEICPSPINPCRLEITGEQIAYTLEQSLLKDYQDKLIRGFGFRGKTLGVMCLAGIKVTYDPSLPDFKKITSVEVNGLPLENGRRYKVGTIDMFTFGVGYEVFKQGENVEFFLPELLREVLEKTLTNQEALNLSRSIHWIDEAGDHHELINR
jgi:5'-nucleotidase